MKNLTLLVLLVTLIAFATMSGCGPTASLSATPEVPTPTPVLPTPTPAATTPTPPMRSSARWTPPR